MGQFYLYGTAFFQHWWPLVSAGSLLGIEEFFERYWGWGSKQLKKIPEARRGHVKVVALLLATFYSGYLAWSDEHAALIAANDKLSRENLDLATAAQKLSQSGAKMNFTRIEPIDEPIIFNGIVKEHIFRFKIWFHNLGQTAARSASLRSLAYLSDSILSKTEEETQFGYALRGQGGDVSHNDTQPSDTAFFYTNGGFTDVGWRQFVDKTKILYLFGQLRYQDELSDKEITTDLCMFFLNGDLSAWNYCASGHNTITR